MALPVYHCFPRPVVLTTEHPVLMFCVYPNPSYYAEPGLRDKSRHPLLSDKMNPLIPKVLVPGVYPVLVQRQQRVTWTGES